MDPNGVPLTALCPNCGTDTLGLLVDFQMEGDDQALLMEKYICVNDCGYSSAKRYRCSA